MQFAPDRTQIAAQAASRQPNPAWPWVAGGAVAAAGVGAYYCWPRQVANEALSVEGMQLNRTIDFKGCMAKLPYQVTIRGRLPGMQQEVVITESFKTLAEAQTWEGPPAAPPTGTPDPISPQKNPGHGITPAFSARGVQRGGGKVPPVCPPGYQYSIVTGQCEAGKVPTACPTGYVWDAVLGVCKPGKPWVPPGKVPGVTAAPRPQAIPFQRRRAARRPSVFAAATGTVANPVATIMSPDLYSYPWAPNMYPPAIYGAYGTPA